MSMKIIIIIIIRLITSKNDDRKVSLVLWVGKTYETFPNIQKYTKPIILLKKLVFDIFGHSCVLFQLYKRETSETQNTKHIFGFLE